MVGAFCAVLAEVFRSQGDCGERVLSGKSLKMAEGLYTSMLITGGRPASFPPSNSTFLSSLCGLGDTR